MSVIEDIEQRLRAVLLEASSRIDISRVPRLEGDDVHLFAGPFRNDLLAPVPLDDDTADVLVDDFRAWIANLNVVAIVLEEKHPEVRYGRPSVYPIVLWFARAKLTPRST